MRIFIKAIQFEKWPKQNRRINNGLSDSRFTLNGITEIANESKSTENSR